MRTLKMGCNRWFSHLVFCSLVAASGLVFGAAEDDPVLTKLMLNQFEWRDADNNKPLVFSGQAWVGQDLKKLWFKGEAERAGGVTERAELQALYSQAVAPFWDLQLGVRRDFLPSPSRNWVVLGLQGLSPYFFEIDTALFIGEQGRTALRFEAGYDLRLTQKLILSPEAEVNLYGKDDAELGIGAGLSDIELGLRLRYEFKREFAPYIGVNWSRNYGKTAEYARAAGEDDDRFTWMLGVRAWF